MPPALRELLVEALTDYSSIAQQAHSIDSNEELLALTTLMNSALLGSTKSLQSKSFY